LHKSSQKTRYAGFILGDRNVLNLFKVEYDLSLKNLGNIVFSGNSQSLIYGLPKE